MKYNILRNTIITGTLCAVLVFPSFAQDANAPILVERAEVIPISYVKDHWSIIYIDQLLDKHDVQTIFNNKELNAFISIEDFKTIVKLIIDEAYDSEPEAMTREAVVYELAKIWADKTDQNLENIPVIKMLIYPDTNEIDAKYNQGITVAYMRNIAKGRDTGLFDPKTEVTYGELAALLNNTANAIEDELKPSEQPIVEGKFETTGSYEIENDKVVFNFELMSHFAEAKELQFGSGQQYEITITDEDGKEVYRYSDDKFFTLALIFKIIGPGESIKWQDEWDMTNKDGKKLTTGNYKAEINVIVLSEEDETIEKSQLTTVIDFSL
ncbi:MAG: hypothetical protein CVV02_07290 [Firmicutes bacterium HGW-Firmicutes-7]|nr:MAG: hypothetical protein CVV02_07290 [Firmicutes bacterium HGW-Firmicutes-7]